MVCVRLAQSVTHVVLSLGGSFVAQICTIAPGSSDILGSHTDALLHYCCGAIFGCQSHVLAVRELMYSFTDDVGLCARQLVEYILNYSRIPVCYFIVEVRHVARVFMCHVVLHCISLFTLPMSSCATRHCIALHCTLDMYPPGVCVDCVLSPRWIYTVIGD